MSFFSPLVIPFDSSSIPQVQTVSPHPPEADLPRMRCLFRSLALLRLSMQAERK
ncbi:hypothetical protein [Chromobacterium sinusclupearum]|uniref:hypothetical protein n=1 Tax=Chromobacterium sinusclupearum TaxID=2077146 RepID=UPI001304B313|nr:hypothetical protein [Chromobacterium sinusclupearum]